MSDEVKAPGSGRNTLKNWHTRGVTLILGANFELFGVMLADSRVSWDRASITRDVCQKLAPFTEAGVIAWAGDVPTVVRVMQMLTDELHATHNPQFVLDEERVRSVLSPVHLRSVPVGKASFISQIIEPRAFAFGRVAQRVEMSVIDVTIAATDRYLAFRHVLDGYVIRGSGDRIAPDLEGLDIVTRTWKGGTDLTPQGVVARCLALDEIVSGLVRRAKIASVGNLFQLAYILNERVRALSYEKWIPTSGGYGTRASLLIEDGRMYQDHKPTGRRTMLLNPFVEDGQLRASRHASDLLFDLEKLSPDDPGVARRKPSSVRPRVLSESGVAGASGLTYRPLLVPSDWGFDPHRDHN